MGLKVKNGTHTNIFLECHNTSKCSKTRTQKTGHLEYTYKPDIQKESYHAMQDTPTGFRNMISEQQSCDVNRQSET